MKWKFDDPTWEPLLEEYGYTYVDYHKKMGGEQEPFIIHYSSPRFHIVIKFRRVVDTLYILNPKDNPDLLRFKLNEIMIYETFNL